MTRAAFTQRDIQNAIRGALKGGLEPGGFLIEISPTGTLRILPAKAEAAQGDDLDRELAEFRARNGHG